MEAPVREDAYAFFFCWCFFCVVCRRNLRRLSMLFRRTHAKLTVLLLALWLSFFLPAASINAASFEFTVTVKTAFDKMTAAANSSTSAKLKQQYADLQAVQKQDIDWDKKVNDLHYKNEEALLATNARIKVIDAAKLSKLENDITAAKKKYEPVFTLYDSLNKQLSIAKSLKNKELTAFLKPQVEAAKVAVQLAKQDIKTKQTALSTAKTAAAKTKSQIKATLAGIDTNKVKVKAAKSTISSVKKQFTTEATILNQVVRKGDATATASSFTRLISYQRQINEQKQKIYTYEQQITSIIAKADSQLAGK